MLGLDAAAQASIERPTAIELVSDSAAYAIVIDQEQQSVYLLNLAERTLLAVAHLTDDVLKWLSVDPLSDKYPNISPYAYCNWNPIKFVDPDGEWVEATDNGDGTYTTRSGEINNDLNIYVVNKNGERTGTILGQTLTPYSFFGNNNQFIEGAVINLADDSGQEFLNHVINDFPNLVTYAMQALPNGSNDFKNNGYTKGMNMTKHHYRAMPINTFDGNGNRIATARDIGNYAAGFVAGSNGISWENTRLVFDWLQGNLMCIQQEPKVSQCAQYAGYEFGYRILGRFLGTKQYSRP
jgi:hypothetical protein